MTDNLPALVQPSREVARTDTDSWTDVFASVVELARGIAETEFVPRGLRGSIPATTAAILYGREVGLPPMTALNSTHVIEGRPSIEAQAMRAMVLAAGHEIEVLETTGAVCKMRGRRNGSERWSQVVEWTIDAARAAGLMTKSNWKNYPRRMLQARATSELCELYFPDVVMGFRSIEEMQDLADGEGPTDEPTTAVQRTPRKRAAAKKATPPAPAADRPAALGGPPLPGEAGFDLAPAETSTGGEVAGEAADPSVDTDDDSGADDGTEAPVEQQSTPDDAPAPESSPDEVDAEIVEDPPEEPGPRRANRAQIRALFKVMERFEVGDDDRHRVVSGLIGHRIESFNDIGVDEISPALDTLAMLKGREDLDALLEAAEQRRDES